HVLQLDGTDYKSFDGFAKQVADIVGDRGLDTLINNAAIVLRNNLNIVTADDMVNNFKVNSVSPLMLTKALLPILKQSGATTRKTMVVNISSIGGSITIAPNLLPTMYYPYCPSKAALNMITKCLSIDLAPHAIMAVAIHPGSVQRDVDDTDGTIPMETSVNNQRGGNDKFQILHQNKQLILDIKASIKWFDEQIAHNLFVNTIVVICCIMMSIYVTTSLWQNIQSMSTVIALSSVSLTVQLVVSCVICGSVGNKLNDIREVLDAINGDQLTDREFRELLLFKDSAKNSSTCGFTIAGFAVLNKSTLIAVYINYFIT
ncbi:unnamed protein product, partial [Medioppia subpectinata]